MRLLIRIGLVLCCISGLVAMAMWARQADPISRHWANSQGSESFVVTPKNRDACPILIFVSSGAETVLQEGPNLRAIAETGMVCDFVAADKLSIDQLGRQLTNILNDRRIVSDTNKQAVIIVGDGTRASTMLIAAINSAGIQPDLFICVPDETEIAAVMERLVKAEDNFHCPLMLASKSKSSDATTSSHAQTEQRRIETLAFAATDDLRPRDLFFYKQLAQHAGEKLAQTGKISDAGPLTRTASAAGWKYFGLPSGLFSIFAILLVTQKINSPSGARLQFRLAIGAAIIIGAIVGVGTSLFAINLPAAMHGSDTKRSAQLSQLASKWDLSRNQVGNFDEYTSLADYTRKIINWKLDEKFYNEYVLNPRVADGLQPELEWRQPLWKYFYPLIRRTRTPYEAANILVNYLRLEVEVQQSGGGPSSTNIRQIWNQRATTPIGFEEIYVAALRSVAVAAKLNSQGRVEIWDDGEWKAAPRPAELVAL